MSLIRRLLRFLGFRQETPADTPQPGHVLRITEQNVYTMVNTITFSSDMEKLFLVDNGRAIEFDLATNNGVLVGTLRGQITVATAFDFGKPGDGASSGNPGDRGQGLASAHTSILGAGIKSVKLETEKTVWAGAYHQTRRVLCLIGATEVEIRDQDDEVDYQPEIHFFELTDNVLHIRRKKNDIFVLSTPRE